MPGWQDLCYHALMNETSDLETLEEYNFGELAPEEQRAQLEEMGRSLQRARGIPKDFNRRSVANAFHDAFECIGGVPRLAVWANHNETEFYKLYARLLPNAASQDFDLGADKPTRIVHSIPRSPLDGEILEASFEPADSAGKEGKDAESTSPP